MNHRGEIEHFCRDFFRGNNTYLNDIIATYRHLLKQIDMQSMNFSRDTLGKSFKRVCEELFALRSTDNAYIITTFAFALEIHEYHKYPCSWYNLDLLIGSMTIVPEEIDFNPKQLAKPSGCILL